MNPHRTHTVRACISISWEKNRKGKELKKEFEKYLLENSVPDKNQMGLINDLMGKVPNEVFQTYDIIGTINGNSNTRPYILKEKYKKDYHLTSLDIFNRPQEIKKNIAALESLLKASIKGKVNFLRFATNFPKPYSLEINYYMNKEQFEVIPFRTIAIDSLGALLSGLIFPFMKLTLITIGNLSNEGNKITGSSIANNIYTDFITTITLTDITLIAIIGIGIFSMVTWLKWRKKKHVIEL